MSAKRRCLENPKVEKIAGEDGLNCVDLFTSVCTNSEWLMLTLVAFLSWRTWAALARVNARWNDVLVKGRDKKWNGMCVALRTRRWGGCALLGFKMPGRKVSKQQRDPIWKGLLSIFGPFSQCPAFTPLVHIGHVLLGLQWICSYDEAIYLGELAGEFLALRHLSLEISRTQGYSSRYSRFPVRCLTRFTAQLETLCVNADDFDETDLGPKESTWPTFPSLTELEIFMPGDRYHKPMLSEGFSRFLLRTQTLSRLTLVIGLQGELSSKVLGTIYCLKNLKKFTCPEGFFKFKCVGVIETLKRKNIEVHELLQPQHEGPYTGWDPHDWDPHDMQRIANDFRAHWLSSKD